jgi:hypothetical protein
MDILLKYELVVLEECRLDGLKVCRILHEFINFGVLHVRCEALFVMPLQISLPAMEERGLEIELSLEALLLHSFEHVLGIAVAVCELLRNKRYFGHLSPLYSHHHTLRLWRE